jgi:effector-binding domain-containing protein
MVVDFGFKKAPRFRIATVSWKGPWNEKKIRSNFEKVAAWAKRRKLPTGKWVFMEPGERKWTVGIEVRGRAHGDGAVRMRTLPAATVAAVAFDPEKLSPRVVYHGLNDWLRWRKKDGEIKKVLSSREVYGANPWTDAKAWARTEVQFVVRK